MKMLIEGDTVTEKNVSNLFSAVVEGGQGEVVFGSVARAAAENGPEEGIPAARRHRCSLGKSEPWVRTPEVEQKRFRRKFSDAKLFQRKRKLTKVRD